MDGEGSGRYLSFDLDGESYAVEVERVEVVLETVPLTRVPKAPVHLRGVINYRGSVIPVADLRVRFGSPPTEIKDGTSIVVLEIRYGMDTITIGILADAVREVVDLDREKIKKAPSLGNRSDDGLIAGVYERDGRFIVVLDIDEAFSQENIGSAGTGLAMSGAQVQGR